MAEAPAAEPITASLVPPSDGSAAPSDTEEAVEKPQLADAAPPQPATAEPAAEEGGYFASFKSTAAAYASSIKDKVKESGLKETLREGAAAVAEHDWRGTAKGLGEKVGGYLGGAPSESAPPVPVAEPVEGLEKLSVSGDAADAAAAAANDGTSTSPTEAGYLRTKAAALYGVASSAVSAVAEDPRGMASAAVEKTREVGGKAVEVGGKAVSVVKEKVTDAAGSERVQAAMEATRSVAGKAMDAGSSALEVTKSAAHVGLEGARGVAGRAGEIVQDAAPVIASGASKTAQYARTHTPAVVATTGGAIGAGLGAIGNTMGAAAGAAAGVAAAHVAHMRLRRAMKDAGVEGVNVIRLSEALETAGSVTAMAALEASSVSSTDALRTSRGQLDESERITVEGGTLYLHQLFDDACSIPAPPSHPAPATRPPPPRLPPAASLAYGAYADATARRVADATAKLEAYRRRAASLRAQIASAAEAQKAQPAGGPDVDAAEVARLRQMGVYSARSMVAAACTGVSELAAGSVHALGEAGGLGLQTIVALDKELVALHESAVHSAAPLSTAAPTTTVNEALSGLSAGGTTSGLGSSLLLELGILVGTYLEAARTSAATAREAAALLPLAELNAPLAALEETLDAFEAGLAVDAAEVRAQLSEALRHLLPVCSLLQPPPEMESKATPAPFVPAPVPAAAPVEAAPVVAAEPAVEAVLETVGAELAAAAVATAEAAAAEPEKEEVAETKKEGKKKKNKKKNSETEKEAVDVQ